jgi:hypothetical protein
MTIDKNETSHERKTDRRCLQNVCKIPFERDSPEFCKRLAGNDPFLQTNLLAKFRRKFQDHRDQSTTEENLSEFCKQKNNRKVLREPGTLSTRKDS